MKNLEFDKPENLNYDLNIIVADTDWKTFEIISKKLKDSNYNTLNLSSDFAVSFILEYEKVDALLISKNIENIDKILKLCQKKKTKVYILGENDLSYPVNPDEIIKILDEIKKEKLSQNIKSKNSLKGFLSSLKRNNINNTNQEDKIRQLKQPIKINDTSQIKEVKKNQETIQVAQFNKEGRLSKDSINENDNFTDLEVEIEYKSEVNTYKSEGNDYNSVDDACLFNKINDETANKAATEKLNSVNFVNFDNNKNSETASNLIAIKQKTISFIKAKGGVGSTILSLYIAFKFSNLKTLLIDLNFSEGGSDIGYYLELPKIPNIMFFTEGYNRKALENSVIKIKDNLDLLQPPPTHELSAKIDLQDIYCLVDIAKKRYHLLIFDLPNYINDIYLGVIDLTDLAILVSDLSFGSIGRLSDINNRFIYQDIEKILVLNKSENRNKNGNGNGNGNVNGNEARLKKLLIDNFDFKNDLIAFVDLKEHSALNGKSEFKNFDFDTLKDFNILEEKVLNKLLI